MGHEMVYAVYRNYVEGCEMMGRDFVFIQKSKSPEPYEYSTGDSLESSFATCETYKVFLERETGFESL
jgi:hypothetical protein